MDSSSSTAAPFCHPKHEVFLSFRGEDTRNNFLYHLYEAFRRKGIGAYVDFNELPRGEEISYALKAIQESMISIIVFSRNYATSSWCLDELSKIMQCRHSRGQLVVPIFYHVNPSDIRRQTGSFEKAFVEHERNRTDKVQGWRQALTEAGNLSGWSLTGDKPEPLVIEEIVHDILNKMNRLSKSDYKGLIRIGVHMEQIKSMLCIGGDQGVRIIGIWGMGGIGKTTLAQAIYDEVSSPFDSCYFLANVREELKKHGAIALRDKLLSKLLDDENLHLCTPMIGSTFIKDRLRRKRVLVVLDDVNDLEQLEILAISHDHFGFGSRIIVTSRDKKVLRNISDEELIYEVKELRYNDSLQLFSEFAFKQNHPDDDFKYLSNSFLEYAKGVPLALKVLGSTLYRKSITYWGSALEGLKQYSDPKIQDVLKISFIGLDEAEKNIFLDIACFFKGYYRDDVTKILDGCYARTAHCRITNLIDKCLLNVTKWNELGMHDLIQEMGRNVLLAESPYLEERSRLWTPDDVRQVLENGGGTKSIKGLLLDQSQIGEIQLDPSAFAMMRHLKIIKFYGKGGKLVPLDLGLESLPNELRYFHWEYCMLKSLPPKFCPEKLVELRLPASKVEQLWNGKQNLVNLRVLDLLLCQNLTRIPDLLAATNIKILLIHGCKSLVELPSMIHLKSLHDRLNITSCNNLKKFPGLPKHLKCLTFKDTAIEEIPESIGYLDQLEELTLIRSRVQAVSENICKLESLKSLELCWNQIEEIPSSVGCLNQLAHLDMSSSRIHNLPSTIVQLDALNTIFLTDCPNITKFPNVPKNIETLCMDHTPIEEVPSSISMLKSLSYLSMRGCTKLKSLPTSFCELVSLRELDLKGCSNLKCFPEISKDMKSLVTLDLSETAIEKVPSSISMLKSLSRLSMGGCTKLKSLPTSICELESLKELFLYDCSNLECFPEISKDIKSLVTLGCRETAVEKVPSSISRLVSLSSLSMGGCTKLKSLPTSICELKYLEKLCLCGSSNLECFTNSFCNLVFLKELDLSRSDIMEIPKSITQLSNLISLDLTSCKNLKSLWELPPCLRFLDVEDCTSLERVLKWERFQYRKNQYVPYFHYFEGNCFMFNNCFNLNRDAVNNIVANAQLIIQCMAEQFAVESHGAYRSYNRTVLFCLTGSEIPKAFKNRSTNSSITVQLSPACSSKRFLGFALCIVVDFEHHFECRTFRVKCKCRFKTKGGVYHNFEHSWYGPYFGFKDIHFESNHVILLYDGFDSGIIEASRNNHFDEASFEFYSEAIDMGFTGCRENIKMQKCGVNVLYVDAVISNNDSKIGYRSDGEEEMDPTNETLETGFHAKMSFTEDKENRCDASMSEPNSTLGPNRLALKCDVNNGDLEGSMMEEDANNEEGLGDDPTTTMRPRLKRSFSSDKEEEPDPQRPRYNH